MSPTWPTSCSLVGSSLSTSFSLCARIRPPSRPVRPTALPPASLIRPTMSCCTSPASTHSTTSMVSSSVTRMPWMKLPFLPSRFSASSICGPPPCTTTGFMPTSFSSTTSSAKSCCSAGSVMALPPYLMTMRLAVELADVGQRLGQDLGLVARGDVGHVGEVGGGHGAAGGWDGGGNCRQAQQPRACRPGSLMPAAIADIEENRPSRLAGVAGFGHSLARTVGAINLNATKEAATCICNAVDSWPP